MRDGPWHGGVLERKSKQPQPKYGKGGPAQGEFQPERIGHRQRGVISLIDIPLWDKARWSGTALLVAPDTDTPPLFGFLFRDEGSARQIFQAWRGRLGMVDFGNELRVAILTGISKKSPHAYRVVIGANVEASGVINDQRLLIMVSRYHTMRPDSSINIDRFLAQYRKVGKYGLAPASGQDASGRPQFVFDLAVGKEDLYVRPAWQVGENDPDFVAIDPDDDPIIPAIVNDPPILRALQRKRSRKKRP